jgi:hypothetical protein
MTILQFVQGLRGTLQVTFEEGTAFSNLFEKVDNLPSGGVDTVLSEEELRSHRRLAMVAGVREKLRILG